MEAKLLIGGNWKLLAVPRMKECDMFKAKAGLDMCAGGLEGLQSLHEVAGKHATRERSGLEPS